MKPVSVAIIGCGAISELYYAPVLRLLEQCGEAQVAALFDLDSKRVAKLNAFFPSARPVQDLAAVAGIEVAIVASPPRFHAEQTMELLDRGVHVLCEKPMAATAREAEQMNAAAQKAGRKLAVGLFRRFFPVNQTVRALVQNQNLGAARSFEISEGGIFNWPAASASFFQKTKSQGGVLADLGVHVLDLLVWWFGWPTRVEYQDDAMGNLEANSRVALEFPGGVRGTVRLSRDTPMGNRTRIEFERGFVRFKSAAANDLEFGFDKTPFPAESKLQLTEGGAAPTYHQCFSRQLRNVLGAARGTEPVFIPGEEGILSLRLVEQCYAQRKLLAMPWLSGKEWERAQKLAGVGA